jgi:hypothetical protein
MEGNMAVKFSFAAFMLSLAALLIVLLRTPELPIQPAPAPMSFSPVPAAPLDTPVLDTTDHGNFG